MGGGGSTSQNTTTQVQQIPAFEQQESQSNQNLANSLGAQAYPTYQAPLQSGFAPQQQQAFSQVGSAATAQQPYLDSASQQLSAASALTPANAQALSSYMSPYVQQSLAPQMTELQTQLGQQQQQLGAQATEANAFGDARQGAQTSLNNFYGDQSMSGLLASGYNTAFSNALSSLNQEQQNQMTGAGDEAALGQEAQSTGISGANALYDAGQQQQDQSQQALNLAYQQYQNQVQWPYQMLNVRESALSNSPYTIANQTTLPDSNSLATSLGSFASTAGGLGSLFGSGANSNIFGSS